MAVIVNGDGILTGISSLATALTDITSGRGTVTGVATVGTLQLGAGVSISSPRTQTAAIFTNNTEFLTIDDAGRVGVGTITPNSDAHPQNEKKINVGFITARSIAGDIDANTMVVAGVSTFVDTLNATQITSSGTVSGTTATFTNGILVNDNISHIDNTNTKIRFPSNNNFTVEVNGSEGFRVAPVGTTVTTNTDASLFINTTNSNGSHIRLQTSGTTKTFFGQAAGISGTLGGADDFGLMSAGNFVIGTNGSATPRFKINTSGQLVMTNTVTTEFIQLTSTNNSTRAVIAASGKDSSGNAVTIKLGGFGDTSRGEIFTQTNHGLGFATNNAATQMLLTTSGSFGIGTNSPDRKLDVSGNGNVYGKFQSTDATGAGIEVKDNSQNWLIQADGAGSNESLAFYDLANTSYRVHMKDNGNVEIVNGNLKVASGHGIDFSATGDGSGTDSSELFDDYEEGSWTPDLHFGGHTTGITYSNVQGSYTKVGRVVTINWTIELSSKGSASGDARIYGYPYAPAALLSGTSVQANGVSSYWNNFEPDMYYMAFFATSAYISIRSQDGGGLTDALDAMSNSDFANNSTFRGSITYFAAS